GSIVRAALDTMSAEVRPGVAAAVLRSSGARSAPMLVYSIHEPPEVPNVEVPGARGRLTRGLVIAVEPMATSGSGRVVEGSIRTADGAPTVHVEHTIVVTDGPPIILTASAA